jgi:hypothetical protein
LQSLSISADVPPRFAALMLAEEASAADVPDIWAAAVEHAAARMSAITNAVEASSALIDVTIHDNQQLSGGELYAGQECNELAVKSHVAICE